MQTISVRNQSTNRLFQILRHLPKTDLKKLVKFITSPYFNKSKVFIRLLDSFLVEVHQQKEGFQKEIIWNKVFPSKPFNDNNFRKACSDLLVLVEKFLAIEEILRNESGLYLDKLDYITRNKIEPLYGRFKPENSTNSMTSQYLSYQDYLHAYEFENKYYKLMEFDVKLDKKINIDKISENLDIFYLIEKLKIICNLLVHKSISTGGFDIPDTEAILKICDKFNLEKHPELAIYYYRYHTLTDGDNPKHYFSLKKTLEKNAQYIFQNDAIEIFDTALNYCISRVNKGEKQFLQEYFDIFLEAIEKGVFIINGELAARRFNNIIVVGLRLNKYEWADEFVEKYKNLLTSAERNNIVNFNKARICSYRKEYANVLNLIRDIDEYEDIIINLISKTMIVFSYYELDEYEPLESFIESFRAFINRRKDIQMNVKQGYLNLLGFVKRIMRVPASDNKAISKLRNDIIAAKATTVNHEWLLEKLEELKGNTSA